MAAPNRTYVSDGHVLERSVDLLPYRLPTHMLTRHIVRRSLLASHGA